MSSGRARRSTAKVVNYAKEQEFSDDDVFEDEADKKEEPTIPSRPSRPSTGGGSSNRSSRKSTGGGGGGRKGGGRADNNNNNNEFDAGGAAGSSGHPIDSSGDTSDDNSFSPPKPVFVEKGYDLTQYLPIRQRFDFMPEYEPDGSRRIELIVGRRPIEDKKSELHKNKQRSSSDGEDDENGNNDDNDDEDDEGSSSEEEDDESSDEEGGGRRGRSRGRRKTPKRGSKKKKSSKKKSSSPKKQQQMMEDGIEIGPDGEVVEYEYLVKYRGRSYLHLEWKTGADLESMNKSAKALYRRYLKKLTTSQDAEELEDPNFDPSFAEPQKIVDEAEIEITVDLSDKELVEWEKEREKALAEEEAAELAKEKELQVDGEGDDITAAEEKKDNSGSIANGEQGPKASSTTGDETSDKTEKKEDEEDERKKKEEEEQYTMICKFIDDNTIGTIPIETLRKLLDTNSGGEKYYPEFDGCDNPYRDGYITTPPKKPRASYLMFQSCMRPIYAKKFPGASQQEIMTIIGNAWKSMSDLDQLSFQTLAKEEADQYEKERLMMEKAQKPSEMWQPIRRCQMVLDRIEKDSFCEIFMEPVDTDVFTDYEEIIDQPMDLGTVRTKLVNRKYQAPENFARDVRKVWNNCKIYNQHGSAIWHVADYMSKQFERLYHAWVLEFRERYLRWVNPKARPWEHTCRKCDGSCGTSDDKMVLCDHCDAMYGMGCLRPQLDKLPEGIWHCPDCKPKLATAKGVRMLSAVSEQAARKRAELGDTPKRRVKQKMYLVKWAGLGYEFCNWETREDIDADEVIEEYYKLNNTTPDEPDVTVNDVNTVLTKAKHINTQNAGGISCIPDVRSQLYAQTRAFQFAKFGISTLPERLYGECGPKMKAIAADPSNIVASTTNIDETKPDIAKSSEQEQDEPDIAKSSEQSHAEDKPDKILSDDHHRHQKHPQEVVQCVTDMVFRVARSSTQPLKNSSFSLPPPLTGEYDAIVPITSKGLMMNVGEIHGHVAFLGYRTFPDGKKGPAELSRLIRSVGDKIIAVDGVSTVDKSFKEVIMMLRESGKNKFAYMRFLESKYSICNSNFTSIGNVGRYTVEELSKKFSNERRRLIVQRRQKLVQEEIENELKKDEESDESVKSKGDDDDEDSDASSEGSFEPDSDVDDLEIRTKGISSEVNKLSQEFNDPEWKKKEKSAGTEEAATGDGDGTTDQTKMEDVSKEATAEKDTMAEEQIAQGRVIASEVAGSTKDGNNTDTVEKNDSKTDDSNQAGVAGGDTTIVSSTTNPDAAKPKDDNTAPTASATNESKTIPSTANKAATQQESQQVTPPDKGPPETIEIVRQETTRSLAMRLLDIDIGYSSDEGGEEDCAYFIDGVDDTFTTMKQAEKDCNKAPEGDDEKSSKMEGKDNESKNEDKENQDVTNTLPVKKNDFTNLANTSKLGAAVAITNLQPDPADFDKFPFPSKKQEAEEAAKKKAEAEARAKEEQQKADALAAQQDESASPSKSAKRSTVKVEQVSTTTNEVIRIWASAQAAAATLQIRVDQIQQMLKGEYDEDLGDEVGGFRWRYAAAGAVVTANSGAGSSRGSKKGKEAFLEFRDKLYDHNYPHVYKNGNKLRDYQIDGVNWLASTWYKRHGCILADEMGLGKTVQIVSYIEHIYRVEKLHRPYLVVVPLSTVEHWRREFQGWTDMVCCVYHDRQRVWRDVMREYEWYYADRPHTPDYLKFDVLVTTYDTLIGDFDVIGQIPWRVAVVDEAHRLRNLKGKLLECMKEISAKGTMEYGFQSRVLMTGTPLQNNTQELWTLLNFIEPFKFPSLEDFETNYGNMANKAQVEALQQQIAPFMLRRVKEDVAKDIPAKEETVIDVELTSIQKQYYRAIFEHNHSFLSMGASRGNAPKLMNIQMELRKCCNHPFLLDGVEQRESDRQFSELTDSGAFEDKSPEEQQAILNTHGYIQTSGKMVLLDKLLPKLKKEGHKILIFSQMVKMLDLISEYCDFRNFRYERLDGRVRGTERQKAIDRFETQDDSFIFLLSTRAGGVGINLTAADICIIFDSDWNPQNDVQAQARCHRIGQTRDVMIYRLVTSRTFEQEMFDRASKKLGLEQAVLGTFNQENDDDKPTSKEMEQLLKKGAYALLEDDDEHINEFQADDIESILAKRTRTRVVEGAKTSSWLNKQGMVVSKSKFSGDTGSATAGVDVDDPMFWQKVMPDFVTPTIMLTKLNELSDLVEGGGSGRGRKKKQPKKEEKKGDDGAEANPEEEKKDSEQANSDGQDGKDQGENPDDEQKAEDNKEEADTKEKDEESDEEKDETAKGAVPISRTNQIKVFKFMSDLKSMMDGIFEEAEDDTLPPSEKAICQKLLLTISIKERLFSEEQRHTARLMLKRLEGDRRRRCRVAGDQSSRAAVASPDASTGVRSELLILSKHQQRRKREKERKSRGEDQSSRKRKKRALDDDEDVGEDGYLVHSDDEADWSDVGEDIYEPKKKKVGISKKEARRRRAWATDKDAATAAGRPWPSFPRNVVAKVLGSVLDEVIKHDKNKGGLFSVPVPQDVFPEYYEQIKHPMDYGTMKEKLDRGEYRSAQAMQKDFILVMQNCLQFNAADSEIVKEARQQALLRPAVLREAAMKNNLFIAEDGSVIEVYDDDEADKKGENAGKEGKKRGRKPKKKVDDNADKGGEVTTRYKRCEKCEGCKREDCGECEACLDNQECFLRKCTNLKKVRVRKVIVKKKKRKKKVEASGDEQSGSDRDDDDDFSIPKKKKPRIRITVSKKKKRGGDDDDDEDETPKTSRKKKRKIAKEGSERKTKKKKIEKVELATDDIHNEEQFDDEVAADEEDDDGIWGNISLFQKDRESLDGTFDAARENFTKYGQWKLPTSVDDIRFGDIARITLNKMRRHDHYSVFADEVSESEAPGYHEVVKTPMDFGKMEDKIEKGQYGTGSKAATALYEDFLLLFDNCALYNDEGGEVLDEATRIFALLPEAYVAACVAVSGKKKKARKGRSKGKST